MSQPEYERWQSAGRPEPVAAKRLEGDAECGYDDCDADADYVVEFENDAGVTVLSKMCASCSRSNLIHVEANGLLEYEVTADE